MTARRTQRIRPEYPVICMRIANIYERPDQSAMDRQTVVAPHDREDQDDTEHERMREWAYFIREYRAKVDELKGHPVRFSNAVKGRMIGIAMLVLLEIGGFTIEELADLFGTTYYSVKQRIKVTRALREGRSYSRARNPNRVEVGS